MKWLEDDVLIKFIEDIDEFYEDIKDANDLVEKMH